MVKKILTLILVAGAGIALGLIVVAAQSGRETSNVMLAQQAKILNLQQKMVSDGGVTLAEVARKQKDMEERLEKLEAQWKKLEKIFEPMNNNPPQPSPAMPAANPTVYDIEAAHSPVRGNAKAPVTIVEFVDFQCPFCSRFYAPVLEILKSYPDKVNYILKNYPLSFHPQSRPAAKAAFAAGEQGKYYEMVDLLLENNQRLNEDTFKELAGKLKLNVDQFLKDYKDKDAQWEKYIEADMALAGRVGVQGTPTFFLNGRETMARETLNFKKEIDEILNKK